MRKGHFELKNTEGKSAKGKEEILSARHHINLTSV